MCSVVIIFIYMNEIESKTYQIVHFQYSSRKQKNVFPICTFWKPVMYLEGQENDLGNSSCRNEANFVTLVLS